MSSATPSMSQYDGAGAAAAAGVADAAGASLAAGVTDAAGVADVDNVAGGIERRRSRSLASGRRKSSRVFQHTHVVSSPCIEQSLARSAKLFSFRSFV